MVDVECSAECFLQFLLFHVYRRIVADDVFVRNIVFFSSDNTIAFPSTTILAVACDRLRELRDPSLWRRWLHPHARELRPEWHRGVTVSRVDGLEAGQSRRSTRERYRWDRQTPSKHQEEDFSRGYGERMMCRWWHT